jgi:hypothetical protein
MDISASKFIFASGNASAVYTLTFNGILTAPSGQCKKQ